VKSLSLASEYLLSLSPCVMYLSQGGLRVRSALRPLHPKLVRPLHTRLSLDGWSWRYLSHGGWTSLRQKLSWFFTSVYRTCIFARTRDPSCACSKFQDAKVSSSCRMMFPHYISEKDQKSVCAPILVAYQSTHFSWKTRLHLPMSVVNRDLWISAVATIFAPKDLSPSFMCVSSFLLLKIMSHRLTPAKVLENDSAPHDISYRGCCPAHLPKYT
jgi:hypothetical protein